MEKKTVLAVILSMAVILVYQMFILPQPPQPPRSKSVQEKPVAQAPAAISPAPAPAPAPPAMPDSEVARLVALQETAGETQVVVKNGLYRVILSSRGGVIASWKLLAYPGSDHEPMEMAPAQQEDVLPPLAVRFNEDGLSRAFADGLYLAQGDDLVLDASHPQGTVTFTRVDPSGLKLLKKLTFHENSYLVDVTLEVQNLGTAGRDLACWFSWGPGLGREEIQRGNFYTGPLALIGPKVIRETPKKDGEQLTLPRGFRWLGLTDRYFLVAFVPESADADAFILRHDKTKQSLGLGPGSLNLPPQASATLAGKLYVGPKSIDILRSYGFGLDQAIDFGWFWWLGKPLLSVLKFFHRFVLNWGVAIILLTLLVKIILFPVTFKMNKSMRRMQAMQPHVLALKKKHKDDPQAMNREVMDLYREHKINPMGGCLPMFIQIPVFIALYKVLSIAIELRGAGFLHIRDLSAGETTLGEFIHGFFAAFPPGLLPLKILVILMGVTMFIQQRMTPAMGDPKQAKMMLFLPFVMTAMFWNFSSGLVVYFFFSNIFSVGEQFLIRKWIPHPAAETEARKGKR